jgi:ribosomal protein S6--L-glutamate ligase
VKNGVPELDIPTIKARVDSGQTSALHAINIALSLKRNKLVRFDINPIQNNLKTVIHCEAPLIDKRIEKL